MSRSRGDRHQWKRKERNKTGESDPAKIRLHRERFRAALKKRNQPVQLSDPREQYKAIVFQAHLRLDPESQESQILLQDQELDIPFLVENPEDCHYAIAEKKKDFDSVREKELLNKHVGKALANNFPCHLEVVIDETRLCSSIIPCHYRQWDSESNQAICTLPKS